MSSRKKKGGNKKTGYIELVENVIYNTATEITINITYGNHIPRKDRDRHENCIGGRNSSEFCERILDLQGM